MGRPTNFNKAFKRDLEGLVQIHNETRALSDSTLQNLDRVRQWNEEGMLSTSHVYHVLFRFWRESRLALNTFMCEIIEMNETLPKELRLKLKIKKGVLKK